MDELDDDLDASKIRQISAIGRALIRTRSYFIIAAGGCVFLAGMLVYKAIVALVPHRDAMNRLVAPARGSQRTGPIIMFVVAAICLAALLPLIRRIRALDREYADLKMQDPATPPDLSTLSDGSQRMTNLENIQFDEAEDE